MGITIIKSMLYRGVAEEWSNHYHLSGPDPADRAAFKTLVDLVVTQEKVCYTSTSNVVRVYAYNAADDPAHNVNSHATWSWDYTISPLAPVPGTLTLTASTEHGISGDQAYWIRWDSGRLNSKGKKIWLRKYMHQGCAINNTPDTLTSTTITNANAFGAFLEGSIGADARHIVGPDGLAASGHGVSTYVTTRTLKRRGKRPPS
jgi:hypothetical protein